jgi:hypothetical protein
MVETARSTVDHSDIRGSSRRLAVMVVIRRELPPTSCVGATVVVHIESPRALLSAGRSTILVPAAFGA